jgi:hypothetical protein
LREKKGGGVEWEKCKRDVAEKSYLLSSVWRPSLVMEGGLGGIEILIDRGMNEQGQCGSVWFEVFRGEGRGGEGIF